MRRIINSASILICVLFSLGTRSLFAAGNDLNSTDGDLGILGAIFAVVVPTLLIIGIGVAIYRRKKPSFSNPVLRRRTPKNWNISPPPTYTSPSPSPSSPRAAARPNRSAPLTEQSEHDASTLESIALTDLAQVQSLRESNRIPEYYEAIAIIIKQYVGEKYQIKSLDAPTGQILSALPNGLTDSVTDHVGEILRLCDMAHFSRHRASRSEQNHIYRTTQEFLESQMAAAPVETDDLETEAAPDEDNEIYKHYGRRD